MTTNEQRRDAAFTEWISDPNWTPAGYLAAFAAGWDAALAAIAADMAPPFPGVTSAPYDCTEPGHAGCTRETDDFGEWIQHRPADATESTEERNATDDCQGCNARAYQCSRGNVCCEDCNHTALWPTPRCTFDFHGECAPCVLPRGHDGVHKCEHEDDSPA